MLRQNASFRRLAQRGCIVPGLHSGKQRSRRVPRRICTLTAHQLHDLERRDAHARTFIVRILSPKNILQCTCMN